MNVLLLGRESKELLPLFPAAGLVAVDDPGDAEAVICHGGDGTLIGAARDYRHLPKVPIRRSSETVKCPRHEDEVVLERVAARACEVSHLAAIEALTRQHRLLAVNEVLIHNQVVTSAVRYRVKIDGRWYFDEIVGDGLVIATPFGSSAYYRSITNSVIQVGIGLAFNNSTEPVNHLVLKPETRIEVLVTRGPAVLVLDNNPLQIPLIEGDVVTVSQAPEPAVIWDLDNLLCMECRTRANGRGAGYHHVW